MGGEKLKHGQKHGHKPVAQKEEEDNLTNKLSTIRIEIPVPPGI